MNTIRNFVRIVSLLAVFASMTLFISCSEDDDADGDCLGCESDAPYSTSGASSCYETLADCTAALGSGCTRCD